MPATIRVRTRGDAGKTVELTWEKVAARMHMPGPCAAEVFGVSNTTFKKVCRRLGIARWPYTTRGRQRRFCAVEAVEADSTPGADEADLSCLVRFCAVEAEAEDSTPGADEADLSWLVPARAEQGSDLWFLGIDYSTPSADEACYAPQLID